MPGGLLVGDVVGKVPSLANVILNAANPSETPLVTRIRKGPSLTQMDHAYFVEEKPARRTDGRSDGEDVGEFGKGTKKHESAIRAQEFGRPYKVGQQTQNVVTTAGIPDQMARLRRSEMEEIMKDAETKMLSSDVSASDEGTPGKGSRMGGLGYLLSAPTDSMTDKPIDAAIRIPANQRYTDTYANFNETALVAAMKARRALCGQSADLVALIGTDLQTSFDVFENYLPTVASNTVTFRSMNGTSADRTVKRGIRFYDGSFGYVELQISDFLPSSKRGYLLDMDQMEWLPFGSGAQKTPLPNLGGGPRELVTFIGAFKAGDVRAHVFIHPSDE